jgi:hypothetical protein
MPQFSELETESTNRFERSKVYGRFVSGTLIAMMTCFAISGWLWLQPLMRTQEAQAVSVDAVRLPRENAPTRVTRELVNIEDVQLGRRVVGRNPLREQTQLPSEIHPETHRTIRLEMIQYGALYELAFVRSLTWISEQQAQVGGMIQLVMTEMGLDGPARVISIEPCPEIEPDDGTGRMVVTGTMKHLAGNVLEIQTADDTEPLGVTDTHPFWSVDRQNFVVAGQLTVGESLEQADGTVTQITRITPTRGPPVMVYNLEIDAEHVFHVGEDGLLVHNSCPELPDEPQLPTRETNPKHHPNSESPEPTNVEELFSQSIADSRGRRWVKDLKGVIHRFAAPRNGRTHWNGSTAGPNPIRMETIPIEIRRLLE